MKNKSGLFFPNLTQYLIIYFSELVLLRVRPSTPRSIHKTNTLKKEACVRDCVRAHKRSLTLGTVATMATWKLTLSGKNCVAACKSVSSGPLGRGVGGVAPTTARTSAVASSCSAPAPHHWTRSASHWHNWCGGIFRSSVKGPNGTHALHFCPKRLFC